MTHPCEGCAHAAHKRSKFFKLLNWCRLYRCKAEWKCVDFKWPK